MTSPVRHEDGALSPRAYPLAMPVAEPIAVGLDAVIFAMHEDEPVVAVVPSGRGDRPGGALPCGPFLPREHDTLEAGLRFWVKRQTGVDLRAPRQLCTIGSGNGSAPATPAIVVCYLALIGPTRFNDRDGAVWQSWYAYLPWEDWRRGKPECLKHEIEPRLAAWAEQAGTACETCTSSDPAERGRRLRMLFGFDGAAWDEEKVLDRYQLLGEAGLLEGASAIPAATRLRRLRHALHGDHARLLAGAVGELRRSIKCQPVVFELMDDTFTLFELQKTVEAILGPHLHKQNFRRLVEAGGLVEPTGEHRFRTGGR